MKTRRILNGSGGFRLQQAVKNDYFVKSAPHLNPNGSQAQRVRFGEEALGGKAAPALSRPEGGPRGQRSGTQFSGGP